MVDITTPIIEIHLGMQRAYKTSGSMGTIRRSLTWLVYPATTSLSVLFALWALGRGWPAWLIGAVIVTVMSVLAELLERIIPYSAQWAKERGDLKTDIWHYFVSNRAFDIGAFIAVSVFAPIGAKLTEQMGIPLWPQHLPLALLAVLALVIVELPWYFIHRLEHRWKLLWRVHSVHHSSTRIYWWNLARNHPIDNLVSALISTAPLALIGVGEAPLALMVSFSATHAMLQHANIDLRTGILDIFLATPRVHRWHHSPRRDEADANYGPTLTLWDWVFGTRRFDPKQIPPENVGLGEADAVFPRHFIGQLAAPFRAELWPQNSSGNKAQ